MLAQHKQKFDTKPILLLKKKNQISSYRYYVQEFAVHRRKRKESCKIRIIAHISEKKSQW